LLPTTATTNSAFNTAQDWNLEQRWLTVLLLLLALYNSPTPTNSAFNTAQDWNLEQWWLTVLLLLLALYNSPN
jgi:hypothetical protein